jgi:hypothetical protein
VGELDRYRLAYLMSSNLLTLYATSAGVCFLLAVMAFWIYQHERDRTGLWFAITGVIGGGTAVAEAANPRLLPWLTPVTVAAALTAWYMKRRAS